MNPHQYANLKGESIDESLYVDDWIQFLYSTCREKAPTVFNWITSARSCAWLAALNYDNPIGAKLVGSKQFLKKQRIDLSECIDPPESFKTMRQIFERKIRYDEVRPMDQDSRAIVSPADSRVLVGSFSEHSQLFIKEKFFSFEELLGQNKNTWLNSFQQGDFAIFRLTPDQYHFNHTPVSGKVVDIYECDGTYHSCNPTAVIEVVTPYSKNRRVITIINTDVEGGSQIGYVAMIEVVALMIGQIQQCYSDYKYDNPKGIQAGMFLKKGQVKSLYRPGSSTDILIFQKDRIQFNEKILNNQNSSTVQSRFNVGFGQGLVETDIKVRSTIATKIT